MQAVPGAAPAPVALCLPGSRAQGRARFTDGAGTDTLVTTADKETETLPSGRDGLTGTGWRRQAESPLGCKTSGIVSAVPKAGAGGGAGGVSHGSLSEVQANLTSQQIPGQRVAVPPEARTSCWD